MLRYRQYKLNEMEISVWKISNRNKNSDKNLTKIDEKNTENY